MVSNPSAHRWIVTADEDEALQGLPWAQQLIYLRALRPYMDYATGIVGLRRGISRRSLRETLYVEPERGRHRSAAPYPTESAVRNALAGLERAGLIEQIESYGRLVFRCQLALVDQSARNMSGRGTADERPTMSDIKNTNHINGMPCMSDPSKALAAHAMIDPPQKSDKNITNSEAYSTIPRVRVDPATVHGRAALVAVFSELGFPHHQVHAVKVMAMLNRWAGEGVTADDVRELVTALRESGRDFGPAYLEGPMRDWLTARSQEAPDQRIRAVRQFPPAWARVPRGDDDLWPWAKQHGYSEPGPGMDYRTYRANLQRDLEKRLQDEERHGQAM